MYTLYGKTGSGSAAVEAALVVAREPFRIVETASWAQNDAYADLLEVNPLGQVPTLVQDDGSALSESAAILIHLGTAHPDSKLLPEKMSGRAQVVRGLVFIAANCYSAISIIDYPERWCQDADGDEKLQEHLGKMEQKADPKTLPEYKRNKRPHGNVPRRLCRPRKNCTRG